MLDLSFSARSDCLSSLYPISRANHVVDKNHKIPLSIKAKLIRNLKVIGFELFTKIIEISHKSLIGLVNESISPNKEGKVEEARFIIKTSAVININLQVSMYVGARMAALEEKRLMTERGG